MKRDHTREYRQVKRAGGYLIYRVAEGNTAEIVDIAVDPDLRQKGIGRTLLEMLFADPDVERCVTVYAITRADNLNAQRFYERCRFEVTGVLRRFYGREESIVDAIMYGRSPKGPV